MKTTTPIVAAGLVAPAIAQYKPVVSSSELVKLVTTEELLQGATDLYDLAIANGGNRAFGSPGHNATVDYIYDALVETGFYDVYKQPFVELYEDAQVEFSVSGVEYDARYLQYSPSGDLDKPLVAVANVGCTAEDFPAPVANNIAFIQRGECSFSQKVANAKTAGAAGAIVYNNVNETLSGTLGGPGDWVPSASVEWAPGQAILAQLASSNSTTASLFINVISENRTTFNVIAETKEGDHNNVLAVGAHTDSVPAGPGINDDGSGTIGILTVAKHLANFSVKNAVRFAFWSAEEFGLLGSYHYLKTINGTLGGNATEVGKLRAYLNFDMIASPNYALGVYDGDGSAFNLSGPPGSEILEQDFVNFFAKLNKSVVPSEYSGRSDYAAFLDNGIPSGGVDTGAEGLKTAEEAAIFGGEAGVAYDVNYHLVGDTVDNLAMDAFLWNTQAIADAVAKYAVDFGSIPKPNHTVEAKKRNVEKTKLRRALDHVKPRLSGLGKRYGGCVHDVKTEL
ncbi:Zn-dependent exopeptidase [Periconia macrospinosa]|uniref:Peptide hydrolase n=1 Tax=Periconia macrospinosa TaxID=97972 RepID=A0A2V1DCD0_9PLEO|nr:Zn-dependent exopeptidase [Periconia macrospinosa]